MTLSSSDLSILEERPVLPVSASKRTEGLKSGALRLTHALGTGMKCKLGFQSLIKKSFEIENHATTEHLPDDEKPYFMHIDDDLVLWPTNGIVEVWTETSNPGEYQVTKYKRLK